MEKLNWQQGILLFFFKRYFRVYPSSNDILIVMVSVVLSRLHWLDVFTILQPDHMVTDSGSVSCWSYLCEIRIQASNFLVNFVMFSSTSLLTSMVSVFSVSDKIPYVETGDYVAYNNERGGVIECLRQDGIVDLDTEVLSVPEWVSAKSMVSSWLADAILYELWLGTDGSSAQKIYYSDLPWPIGKVLFLKKVHSVKLQLGINKENAERREEQVIICYCFSYL